MTGKIMTINNNIYLGNIPNTKKNKEEKKMVSIKIVLGQKFKTNGIESCF